MEDNSKDIERAQKKQDQMLQEQIDMQNAELESKRQEVFTQRKRILDTQRGPTWTTDYNKSSPSSISTPRNQNPMNAVINKSVTSIFGEK